MWWEAPDGGCEPPEAKSSSVPHRHVPPSFVTMQRIAPHWHDWLTVGGGGTSCRKHKLTSLTTALLCEAQEEWMPWPLPRQYHSKCCMANADIGLTMHPDAQCTSLSRMRSLPPICTHSLFHNFIVWIVWLLVYINSSLHISPIVHSLLIPVISHPQCLLLWLR